MGISREWCSVKTTIMNLALRIPCPARLNGFAGSLAIHVAIGMALFLAPASERGDERAGDRGQSLLVVNLIAQPHEARLASSDAPSAPPGQEVPTANALGIKASRIRRGDPAGVETATMGSGAHATIAEPGTAATIRPAAASATSGAGLESFRARLLNHIERFRRYPPEAQKAAVTGATQVHFVMNHAGDVEKIWVESSSGSALLDDAAMAAVMRARPLPSPPSEWPDAVSVSLPIEFALQ